MFEKQAEQSCVNSLSLTSLWKKKKGLHVISLIFLIALKNFSQMTNIFSSQMFHLLQKFKTHIFSLLSVCLLQNKVKTVAFCFWNLFVWKWTNFQHFIFVLWNLFVCFGFGILSLFCKHKCKNLPSAYFTFVIVRKLKKTQPYFSSIDNSDFSGKKQSLFVILNC